jgi:polysaccharide biosynthesis protein PslH
LNNIEWRKVRRLERHVWSEATLNIATSDRDAERIRTATDAVVPVVPNGVDLSAYSEVQPSTRVPGRVVFVGAMRHQPNARGARWYAEQVHPLVVERVPGATFEIVGADPPPDVAALASDTVTVTGRVDSVVPHLARAAVAVVPLAAGGGTRLKLLEAFASGVPVVSTSVGAEGLDVQRDKDVLIADTPRAFADAVVRALRGDGLPSGYSTANGRKLVQSHYDWESAVVPELVAAHEMAIERFERAQGSSPK